MPRILSRVGSVFILGAVVLAFLTSPSATLAQDVGSQATMPGSIQAGTWQEEWNQPGTSYCPNNRQRYVTSTNERFTLSTPPGEGTLSVAYETSRVNLYLARTTDGRFVHTRADNEWVHLLDVTRITPSQMLVISTFYAQDGSCTLSNSATWTLVSPATQTCTVTPISLTLNKRTGPGLNYPVVGQLRPNTSATAIARAYDQQGRPWWQLADSSWVSANYTRAQGTCPS